MNNNVNASESYHCSVPKKLCRHLAGAEAGDVDYYRYFTGNGAEYYLICEECLCDKESFDDNLTEVSEDLFFEHDRYLFGCTGINGNPQIISRKTHLEFVHTDVKLASSVGEKILAYQPLNDSTNCEVIALTESFRLLNINLYTRDYCVLCFVLEKAQIDLHSPVSIEISKNGDLCAIVNTKGQFGEVVDTSTGQVLMRLDRGDYYYGASKFPIAFISWKEKTFIIHSTASKYHIVSL